jgi:hypothetical protein
VIPEAPGLMVSLQARAFFCVCAFWKIWEAIFCFWTFLFSSPLEISEKFHRDICIFGNEEPKIQKKLGASEMYDGCLSARRVSEVSAFSEEGTHYDVYRIELARSTTWPIFLCSDV